MLSGTLKTLSYCLRAAVTTLEDLFSDYQEPENHALFVTLLACIYVESNIYLPFDRFVNSSICPDHQQSENFVDYLGVSQTLIDCGGGGHCQYMVFAQAHFQDAKRYQQVRNEVADYMENNWGLFENFFHGMFDNGSRQLNMKQYIRGVRTSAYGNNMTLHAICNRYQVNITQFPAKEKVRSLESSVTTHVLVWIM